MNDGTRLIVATEFPHFTLFDMTLQFAENFDYLCHMINNELSDNDDMKREIRNIFMKTNILTRCYSNLLVKCKADFI